MLSSSDSKVPKSKASGSSGVDSIPHPISLSLSPSSPLDARSLPLPLPIEIPHAPVVTVRSSAAQTENEGGDDHSKSKNASKRLSENEKSGTVFSAVASLASKVEVSIDVTKRVEANSAPSISVPSSSSTSSSRSSSPFLHVDHSSLVSSATSAPQATVGIRGNGFMLTDSHLDHFHNKDSIEKADRYPRIQSANNDGESYDPSVMRYTQSKEETPNAPIRNGIITERDGEGSSRSDREQDEDGDVRLGSEPSNSFKSRYPAVHNPFTATRDSLDSSSGSVSEPDDDDDSNSLSREVEVDYPDQEDTDGCDPDLYETLPAQEVEELAEGETAKSIFEDVDKNEQSAKEKRKREFSTKVLRRKRHAHHPQDETNPNAHSKAASAASASSLGNAKPELDREKELPTLDLDLETKSQSGDKRTSSATDSENASATSSGYCSDGERESETESRSVPLSKPKSICRKSVSFDPKAVQHSEQDDENAPHAVEAAENVEKKTETGLRVETDEKPDDNHSKSTRSGLSYQKKEKPKSPLVQKRHLEELDERLHAAPHLPHSTNARFDVEPKET